PARPPARRPRARDAAGPRGLRPRPALRGARVARRRPRGEPVGRGRTVQGERVLEPEQLARYADAVVKASLGVTRGETLIVQGEPAHRELALALVESGYRAGAK